MTEDQASKLRTPLMVLAWISALYGVVLLIDVSEANNTAGWMFFLIPIVIVVGERITRGEDDEDDAEAADDEN